MKNVEEDQKKRESVYKNNRWKLGIRYKLKGGMKNKIKLYYIVRERVQ